MKTYSVVVQIGNDRPQVRYFDTDEYEARAQHRELIRWAIERNQKYPDRPKAKIGIAVLS